MKIPVKPRTWGGLSNELDADRMLEIFNKGFGPEQNGKYYHWDKMRYLTPPKGFTAEEWWFGVSWARMTLSKELIFKDKASKSFNYVAADSLIKCLHLIDQKAGGAIASPESDLLNSDTRDRYLINSLFEEAITSSQLEGAATTRKVAKEMLRTKRKPMNKSERMIVNNYRAMLFIREQRKSPLSSELIQELHTIVCDKTLDDESSIGKWRRENDDVSVYDNRDNTILHIPPNANELDNRVKLICDFANENDNEETFMHPVIKAIILHFMIGYDHPFVDGNGRTARAIFYWYMARSGYWLIEFISISSILRKKPVAYARSYLYTETDNNDLTHFVLHQCDVILKAIEELNTYVRNKANEQRNVDQLLRESGKGLLNYRQTALITHAIRHPDTRFTVQTHESSHGISNQTSRTDINNLVDLGLLIMNKRGRRYEYYVPDDLEARLKNKR